MIVYIITDIYQKYLANMEYITFRNMLEETAKDTCIILPYKKTSLALLKQIKPWAICHSGSGTDYKDYDVMQNKNYRSVVMESDIPQIGFCGGHQIIATLFGSTLGPMRKLKSNEPDLDSSYRPGCFKEWGVSPVHIIKNDPIFQKCGKNIMVHQRHYWEVKKMGPQLALLASSKACRVQAFKHISKPIYGVQFHPEIPDNFYKDGKMILENFVKIARAHSRNMPARKDKSA